MSIRKHGVAGEVTGVEQDGITAEAARDGWDADDDRELAAENSGDGQAPGDDD